MIGKFRNSICNKRRNAVHGREWLGVGPHPNGNKSPSAQISLFVREFKGCREISVNGYDGGNRLNRYLRRCGVTFSAGNKEDQNDKGYEKGNLHDIDLVCIRNYVIF